MTFVALGEPMHFPCLEKILTCLLHEMSRRYGDCRNQSRATIDVIINRALPVPPDNNHVEGAILRRRPIAALDSAKSRRNREAIAERHFENVAIIKSSSMNRIRNIDVTSIITCLRSRRTFCVLTSSLPRASGGEPVADGCRLVGAPALCGESVVWRIFWEGIGPIYSRQCQYSPTKLFERVVPCVTCIMAFVLNALPR